MVYEIFIRTFVEVLTLSHSRILLEDEPAICHIPTGGVDRNFSRLELVHRLLPLLLVFLSLLLPVSLVLRFLLWRRLLGGSSQFLPCALLVPIMRL